MDEQQIWIGNQLSFCSIELLTNDDERYIFRYREEFEHVDVFLTEQQILSLHKALTQRFGQMNGE